ncbi:MAG: hypothetical protein IJS58_03045 [Bacilli bacterium]|nr:hypothetical protein [Bacilli bacterium]
MPENFTVNKRLLTDEEKYRRAIFFYTFDSNIKLEYESDNFDDAFDEYGQPLIKIKDNFDKLDDETKSLVLEFVKQDVYDESVDFKCIRCNYEERVDYEEVCDLWDEDEEEYPKLYCPECDKPYFIPLDIWNKKKNK